jgi:parallel beta helix pectate lyase-like protein
MECGAWVRRPSRAAGLALIAGLVLAGEARSTVRRVPQSYAGIQAAIDAAQSGDTVLVSPGTYAGGLSIAAKSVVLASTYISTGDPGVIPQTTIDGGAPILTVQASAGAATTVRGLTFRNGDYQLMSFAPAIQVLDCRFIDGSGDQVSFESAGGLVRDCFFDNAGDDGIDSDGASHPTIEHNTIQNAGNDGIEIRLHAYTGTTLEVLIRNNAISASTEDGIQLIDYAGASSRRFRIEGNAFTNNGKAGLGCMADGNSVENFVGAPLVERVEIIGNTFSGNPHGLTGGDNMLVMNNIFVGAAQIGVKRVAGSSLVTYSDFWGNGTDHTGSNLDLGTTLFQQPLLDANYQLQSGSPCIDAGTGWIVWNGGPVSSPPYAGSAPDLGAHEYGSPVSVGPILPFTGLALSAVRPNPSRDGFTVAVTLPDDAPARIEVVDLAGRRVLGREIGGLGPGQHVVALPEARTLPTGVYLVCVWHGGRTLATRAVVVR